MRLLKFNVNTQHIQKDPSCNFTGIVAGTQDYLKAHFTFSPEWQDCIIVASFWRDKEDHAVFVENGECMIPRIKSVDSRGYPFTWEFVNEQDLVSDVLAALPNGDEVSY